MPTVAGLCGIGFACLNAGYIHFEVVFRSNLSRAFYVGAVNLFVLGWCSEQWMFVVFDLLQVQVQVT